VKNPSRPKQHRRTVAARILYSYLLVLILFAMASAWSVVTFRQALSEAALLRQGYLPLALSLRDLVSNQDTWNSQLNHVTAARNPTDARVWFDTALSVGRPKKLAEVQAKIRDTLFADASESEVARGELLGELGRARRLMEDDSKLLPEMFLALERGEGKHAEACRDALVRAGLRVQRSLLSLEERVTVHVDGLVDEARGRERTALQGLTILGLLTLLVGFLMALYARRVLRPLSLVIQRADAVASGDLSARKAIDSGDEIGELSATFESMVTAIADAREKVLATERLAAIGKMAAHVTHEVRNPLSSIALNLDLLEEELEGDATESRALLQAIGKEVARLSRLSDQYLSMARRKAPEFEESDVGSLVRASIDFMRPEVEGHGLRLSVKVESNLPWVMADQGQIRQAIFNLIRNAREAMPDGGDIEVSVFLEPASIVICVSDTGPGVPAEEVKQLFDPFFTTKSHGTGLGLAVTRQILTAHGGRLSYEAKDPHGSIFSMVLPLEGKTEDEFG
jgi:two-component system NtrC family sensor kinase